MLTNATIENHEMVVKIVSQSVIESGVISGSFVMGSNDVHHDLCTGNLLPLSFMHYALCNLGLSS